MEQKKHTHGNFHRSPLSLKLSTVPTRTLLLVVRVAPDAPAVRTAPADTGLRDTDGGEVVREPTLVTTPPSRFELPRVVTPCGPANSRSLLDLAGRVVPCDLAAAKSSRLSLTGAGGFRCTLVGGGGSVDDTVLASSVTGSPDFSSRLAATGDCVAVGANLFVPSSAVASRGAAAAAAAAAAATAATARALLLMGADAGRVFLKPSSSGLLSSITPARNCGPVRFSSRARRLRRSRRIRLMKSTWKYSTQ